MNFERTFTLCGSIVGLLKKWAPDSRKRFNGLDFFFTSTYLYFTYVPTHAHLYINKNTGSEIFKESILRINIDVPSD